MLADLYLLRAWSAIANTLFLYNQGPEKHILAHLNGLPFDDFLLKKQAKELKKSMMQGRILYRWYESLSGKPISPEEVMRCLYLGAMMRVYDDLMDDFGYTHQDLMHCAALEPNALLRTGHEMELLSRILLNIFAREAITPRRAFPYFEYCLQEMGAVQNDTLRQRKAQPISREEIRQITYKKGAFTMLIHRALLDAPMREGEEEAFSKLGAFIQLADDVLDLYKDTQEGVQTLPSTAMSMPPIKEEMDRLLLDGILHYGKMPYLPAHKQRTLMMVLAIACTAQIAIDQLIGLQADSPFFVFQNFTRQQIVCDMEKPGNMLKNYFYMRKWAPIVHQACY